MGKIKNEVWIMYHTGFVKMVKLLLALKVVFIPFIHRFTNVTFS